jgi:hypothetical protein
MKNRQLYHETYYSLNKDKIAKQGHNYYFKNKEKILEKIKINKCIDCGTKIKLKNKRCRKCYNLFNIGINHPRFDGGFPKCKDCGKKISYQSKWCVNCAPKYKKYSIHHIDMNKLNNKKINLLKLFQSKHSKLHQRAYEYLVSIGLVRKYIKWFDKKYHLKG